MKQILQAGLVAGVDLIGATDVCHLKGGNPYRDPARVMPGGRTVIMLGMKVLDAAFQSSLMHLTIHEFSVADRELTRVAHYLGRLLEKRGHRALLIPGYYPLEMNRATKGLVGDISLKRAAALAGLGRIGYNSLLITPEYGPRVRLAGILTDMPSGQTLVPDELPDVSLPECKKCQLCMRECPAQALTPQGINVKSCIEQVGSPYGLSPLIKFLLALLDKSKDEAAEAIASPDFWNFYQTFMVGNYFNCHRCMSICPKGV